MDGFSTYGTPKSSKTTPTNTTNTESSSSRFAQFQQHQIQQQWYTNYSTYQHGCPPPMQPIVSQAGYPSPIDLTQCTINSSSSSQKTNVQNNEIQNSPESQSCDAIRRVGYNRFVCAEEDNNDETVEETPIEKRGKVKKPKAKQEKKIPWNSDEEKALLEGWIDVSEDGVLGTSQDKKGLWKKITVFFHGKMGKGVYRTPDGLYSKFGPMNTDLTKFMGILNKYTNTRQSGWSDKDIYIHSLNEFSVVTGKAFKLTHLVDIARCHPKWSSVPPFAPSAPKRAKTSETTSSDTPQLVELDNDDMTDFQEPRRPDHGKKKAGKLAAIRRLASSSSSHSNKNEKIDMLNATMNRVASLRQEQNDFKILGKQLECYSGEQLKIMQALQKRAMERNMKYVTGEEDDNNEE